MAQMPHLLYIQYYVKAARRGIRNICRLYIVTPAGVCVCVCLPRVYSTFAAAAAAKRA